MSLIKSIMQQLGLSTTPANNFTLDASADNGTMKLARGNAGETTQDIMTVDAAGKVAFPQGPVQTGPAFSATPAVQSGASAFTFATYTELFDTNNCFDPTNGRFTPNVAGYYDMNGMLQNTQTTAWRLTFLKNGTVVTYGPQPSTGSANNIRALIYMNGTTDFLQMGISTSVAYTTETGADRSLFQGFLARAA